MEKRTDISKALALVLIILTVLISAASTWVLITSSMSSEPGGSFNRALVHLSILKGPERLPAQADTNSGDVKLYISQPKEVS
ncbi:hypothetical protein KY363_02470 [Candidatus Woesearchaeota archaeon]|nr:hypothetical protein [Candidatus Woesearchaeota archaeon]